MTIKLPRLPLNWEKQPQLLERYWNETMRNIESILNSLQLSENRTKLFLSYVQSATPVLSVNSLGTVTIGTHQRVYNDGTSVNISGGTLPTTGTAGDILRIYYTDADFAGGTVVFQYSKNNINSPPQADNIHVVGEVVVPATGTSQGVTTSSIPYFSI